MPDFTTEQLSLLISGALNIIMILGRAVKTKNPTEVKNLFWKIVNILLSHSRTKTEQEKKTIKFPIQNT